MGLRVRRGDLIVIAFLMAVCICLAAILISGVATDKPMPTGWYDYEQEWTDEALVDMIAPLGIVGLVPKQSAGLASEWKAKYTKAQRHLDNAQDYIIDTGERYGRIMSELDMMNQILYGDMVGWRDCATYGLCNEWHEYWIAGAREDAGYE